MSRIRLLSWTIVLAMAAASLASDHADTPELVAAERHDARITDLFVFLRDENLVLALCADPTIGPELREYRFPPDLTFEFFVDNDSAVSFDDPVDLEKFGGTVLEPEKISEDVFFRVTFTPDGEPELETNARVGGGGGGCSLSAPRKDVKLFVGLRDDPFIRGPRIGRNVACVVLEVPLAAVLEESPVLLVWATSKVEGLPGDFQDLAGRAMHSQNPETNLMNTLHPSRHRAELGEPPDVVIFDTSRPAGYPNGRELTDDVVDLVGDPRALATDDPYPDANDVPFLGEFPYLAPPHEPAGHGARHLFQPGR
ncbi:MAG: hypothetical protein KatS3mg076_3213 [Candidatus Binatia bacterium]|nr:MAG: hypothetical protein KatS3mg076_3213 [Candidatus Binatia bacterium]